jgi:hypothetical protein
MRRMQVAAVTGVVGVGLGVPLATAQASSPTLVQAIMTAEHSVENSSALQYLVLNTKSFKTAAGRKAALPRVVAVGKLYAQISRDVAKSTASTSTQKTARTAWVLGAKLGSEEYAALAQEFRDVAAGDSAAAATYELRGLADAKSAKADFDKADKLLGLPAGT